ncbi:SDR family NAD(P)-dependent oxidoreductase [Microvirga alba]|uniref:SDR family NAD(P)-dependent oxidoreductase n=1 Tax=Microvirga alba TaxID=2791025 RepID=A0A931BPS0_9HYPH|nr:SDR family NAD(P)-dependent oxidoreductase [Microvirga alba]MBF9233818.1 SDR family NAD(P)-dependent oxidoreductase [Microvirga alba]
MTHRMPLSLKPIEEQIVVIAGASSDVGMATARLLASRGVRGLVLTDSDPAALRRISDEVSRAGSRALAISADVNRRDDLERVAKLAIDAFGRFDTWIDDRNAMMGLAVAVHHLRKWGGGIVAIGRSASGKDHIDRLRMRLRRAGAPVSITLVTAPFLSRLATKPQPIRDPHLAAGAIVFATENPRREIDLGRPPRGLGLLRRAQRHPYATGALLAGIGAALAAFLMPKVANRSRPRPRRTVEPEKAVTRQAGNGEHKTTLGPGHVSQRDGSERRPPAH